MMIHFAIVRFQYACWCIQFWMSCHVPYFPTWLRLVLFPHYPRERHALTKSQIAAWQHVRPGYVHLFAPLPWYLGQNFQGPLVDPWRRVQRFFRSMTGGRSHRCEFTDPEQGALYGHNEGPFMNRLFETFLANISADSSED